MIINKIRIQEEHPMTGASASWPLPLCTFNLDSTAGENGYILKEVLGLGPPKLLAVVEGFDIFGTPIMGSTAEKRELAFKIGLNPGIRQSYSTLRDNLYKFIDRTVLFSLMNDSEILAQTSGYIRSVEPVHFTNQPEMEMTIECDDGEFSAPNSVAIPLTTLDNTSPVINYQEGTAPTGLELQFKAIAAGTVFTISNYARVWFSGADQVYTEFSLTYNFLTNDIITISTYPGKRFIHLLRGVTTYDLAGFTNGGAVWPKLYSGVNTFEWTFSSSWMEWLSVSYIPKYWGV